MLQGEVLAWPSQTPQQSQSRTSRTRAYPPAFAASAAPLAGAIGARPFVFSVAWRLPATAASGDDAPSTDTRNKTSAPAGMRFLMRVSSFQAKTYPIDKFPHASSTRAAALAVLSHARMANSSAAPVRVATVILASLGLSLRACCAVDSATWIRCTVEGQILRLESGPLRTWRPDRRRSEAARLARADGCGPSVS